MKFTCRPLILVSLVSPLATGCLVPEEAAPPGSSGGAQGSAGGSVSSGGEGTSGGASSGGESSTGGAPSSGGTSDGGTAAGGDAFGIGGMIDGVGGMASGGDGNGGGSASGGVGGSEGSGGASPSGLTAGACTIGAGTQAGEGQTKERYLDADVTRDGKNYMMITNGWGQGFVSHDISWLGTSMTVHGFEGSRQTNGAPAGYPTVFCGRYSDKTSKECGLPTVRSSISALNTAASWTHEAADGTYNVAYDIWMGGASTGFGSGLQSYFMVWLHDPIGEGPAGSPNTSDVIVADLPGVWQIIAGTVNNLPIVNYVRAEGEDSHELAFDVMDFVRDAESRNLTFPGDQVLSVAIGFEIWQGSVTDLQLNDFCVDVQQ